MIAFHGETFLSAAAHIHHAIANIWAAHTLILELKNAESKSQSAVSCARRERIVFDSHLGAVCSLESARRSIRDEQFREPERGHLFHTSCGWLASTS
jgi:hypothetical protein